MDLSGLPETAVDSEEDDDEEDIERASDPLMSRDIVRDCLEKDPMDRTDDDIGKRYLINLPPCQRSERMGVIQTSEFEEGSNEIFF